MSNPLRRLLVAGYGRMGQIRCRDIFANPRLQLAGLVEPNPEARERFLSEFGEWNIPVYNSVDEGVSENKKSGCYGPGTGKEHKLGGIWISTGTDDHVDSIIMSAKHKLAIGIEKPIAATEEEIKKAYAVANESKVPIVCSFQRRLDPTYQNAIENIKEKRVLRNIRSIHAIFRDHPVPPIEFLKTGGDIFHDLAVHDVDYICHVLQEAPTSVYAVGSSFYKELKDIGVLDQATVVLTFPSGCVATLELSRSCAYGYDQRIEFNGENGAINVTNPLVTSTVGSFPTGITHDIPQYSFPQRFSQAYKIEMNHFLDVLDGFSKPLVTMEDCLLSTRIARALGLSQKQGSPVLISDLDKNNNISAFG